MGLWVLSEYTIMTSLYYYLFIGCAFVTYASKETAKQAQTALHDKITLPTVCYNQQYSIAFV